MFVVVIIWKGKVLGFILLLLQAAVLLRSDAGSDDVEPASGFVLQNHQTSSFKTVKPQTPYGAQCMGHAGSMVEWLKHWDHD